MGEIILILILAAIAGVWLAGSLILAVVFIFANAFEQRAELLKKRLLLAAIWPIALLILQGRDMG